MFKKEQSDKSIITIDEFKKVEIENKIDEPTQNSEEEPIIVHLPISLEDVVNISNDDSGDKIFIKSEKDLLKVPKPNINEVIQNDDLLLNQYYKFYLLNLY